MFLTPKPRSIRFRCRSEDDGVIPPPVPAKTFMPDWFRKLPAVDPEKLSTGDSGLTVKRCMPFLDAMTAGWIIRLAATVRMETSNGGSKVDTAWDFDRTLVSNHGAHQVAGNPRAPLPPCKFHNYWSIRTPPGWSCLFVQPLNRPNGIFEIVSGVVDTDSYTAEIHFPFFATGTDGLHIIEKGAPIAQVIPFERKALELSADICAESEDEKQDRARVFRNTISSDGWYRKFARAQR